MISIIVPVYNVESYIRQCIDSVISQSYQNWELLLIDDGSTDNSGIICDEYSLRESRIKVFHQKNLGVSAARNVGLRNATGDYMTFADGDDWLEPYTFQTYVEAFNNYNVDIVRTGFYHEHEDGTIDKTCILEDEVFHNTWSLFKRTEESKYYSFLWNSCLRRSCVKGIYFDEGLNWLEDHTFMYRCYLISNSYVMLAKPTYHYVRHDNTSLAHVRNSEVIFEAANIEYTLKKQLLNGNELNVLNSVMQCYQYRLHSMVENLYMTHTSYFEKKKLSVKKPLISYFACKEERIFFSPTLPFVVKHLLIWLIYLIREIYTR